ncbi:Periphilin-1 [Nymphon striatum]|nr:Periphilin-1 [Nymphon striatum]
MYAFVPRSNDEPFDMPPLMAGKKSSAVKKPRTYKQDEGSVSAPVMWGSMSTAVSFNLPETPSCSVNYDSQSLQSSSEIISSESQTKFHSYNWKCVSESPSPKKTVSETLSPNIEAELSHSSSDELCFELDSKAETSSRKGDSQNRKRKYVEDYHISAKQSKKENSENDFNSYSDSKNQSNSSDYSSDTHVSKNFTSTSRKKRKIGKKRTLSSGQLHTIKRKCLKIEAAYYKDCETYSCVVKNLLRHDPSIQDKVEDCLQKCLKKIYESFINELDEYIDSLKKKYPATYV